MRTRSFDQDKGLLYLVATPIGNLEDFSYRAVNVLKSVSKIYAEDTRNSLILLRHYQISTPLESYHEFSDELKTKQIVAQLLAGNSVAVISDAGLPIISDPGYKLVKEALAVGLAVTTIPGASAGISALVASGLVPYPFTFYGFLNSKVSKRRQELESLKDLPTTLIFYEAPHRIMQTCETILEVLGDRKACLARELTKSYEEYIRGSISEIISCLPVKGELVLIVEGKMTQEQVTIEDAMKYISSKVKLGLKPNEAIKEVAKEYRLDRRLLYEKYLQIKEKSD